MPVVKHPRCRFIPLPSLAQMLIGMILRQAFSIAPQIQMPIWQSDSINSSQCIQMPILKDRYGWRMRWQLSSYLLQLSQPHIWCISIFKVLTWIGLSCSSKQSLAACSFRQVQPLSVAKRMKMSGGAYFMDGMNRPWYAVFVNNHMRIRFHQKLQIVESL